MATSITYNFEGFLENDSFLSTSSGAISQFGQLSDYSRTFSTNKFSYTNEAVDINIHYENFYAVDGSGNSVSLPTNAYTHVLAVGLWLYGRVTAKNISLEAPPFPNFVNQFNVTFSVGALILSNISIGTLVQSVTNAAEYCPDYIQWTVTDTSNNNDIYNFKIWFVDNSFKIQYDKFEIIVIPPFTPIDGFNNTQANVNLELLNQTIASNLVMVSSAIGYNPPTIINTQQYMWFEPTTSGGNGTVSTNTTWTFIIYGPVGNKIGNLANAAVSYLQNPANSALTANQWQSMFPAIFQSVMYFIIPLWDRLIETGPTPLFSPIANYGTSLTRATKNVPSSVFTTNGALVTYWNQYLYGTTSTWQDIFFWVISSPLNFGSDYDFSLKFPDYMNIDLTSPDAAKMSPTTINFVTFLELLISTAYYAVQSTPQSQLPNNMQITIINGLIYIEGLYNGVSYLVISKGSYIST